MDETTVVVRWTVGLLAALVSALVFAMVAASRVRHRRRRNERERRFDDTGVMRVDGALRRAMIETESRVARSLSRLTSRRSSH